jgi:hypothetical protein
MKSLLSEEPFLNTAAFSKVDLPIIEINNTIIQLDERQIISKLSANVLVSMPNAISNTEDSLVNELISDTSQLLYNEYLKLGEAAAESQLSSTKKVLRRIFKINFPAYVRDSNELGSFLMNQLPFVFSGDRFCILPIGLAQLMLQNPDFVPTSLESRTSPGGIYLVGTYSNKLDIYVNTSIPWDSTQVIIGLKTNFGNDGVYVIEGISELLKTEAFAESTNTLNMAVRSLQAIKKIGDSADSHFMKLEVINKKRPFLRKLFNF